MRELKKAITALLRTVYPTVYYENADPEAGYPYIVYSFGVGWNNRHNEIIPIDIDVWDLGESSAQVDEIVTSLKELDGLNYKDHLQQFSLYYDRNLDTSPEDRRHKRKTVTLELRYHKIRP